MTRDLDDVLARLRRLHPLMMDLSLERIQRLLVKLGSPEKRLPPVVHIAGTNGKGSTTAYLKAIFEAAGKRVHAYTSPHLVRFAERISVPDATGASRPIDDVQLTALLRRVEEINAGDPITFFEVTTAAALLAFAEITADVVLLEVGLGGEFDTTNVVDRPALTIITPVAMDHAEKLGPTLAHIAKAKAGILKRGVPGVISVQGEEALEVIERRAAALGAPLRIWGRDFDAFAQNGRMVFQGTDEVMDLPLPALIGRHQIVNAGTAVAAVRALRMPGVDEASIARGLVEVTWPARMQRIAAGHLVDRLPEGFELWLDGGHNPHCGSAIAQTLADLEERSPKPLCLVVGMMGQKDTEGFLTPFRGLAKRLIAVPIPGAHEAPHTPEAVARIGLGLGFSVATASGVPAALDRLKATEALATRVLICGSLYLAGHVLAMNEGRQVQMN
ncbi:MAG: folylpolyglutamate synthase/dihydrofolate synthase family protein [Hyphomicrobiaceae bacterium]